MDAERRRQLEQKRRFAKPRIGGPEFRADRRAEPAFHVMEQAGESFSFYALRDAPDWVPGWWPMSYSRVPWSQFPDAVVMKGGRPKEELRSFVMDFLSARLGPADRMLVCGQVILELQFAAFERHYDAIVYTYGGWMHFAAPPAQWVFQFEYGEMAWRDPADD